jgi:Acetyl-CoA carboxylase, carboxyltransferase component (subunits alpha and beta)
MSLLQSRIERSGDFDRRAERMAGMVVELRERSALVAAGGGLRAVERHHARGKLLARERSTGCRSGHGVPRAERAGGVGRLRRQAPSAGIVTGVGSVEGASA